MRDGITKKKKSRRELKIKGITIIKMRIKFNNKRN
jgi:hypothetical protein